MIPFKDSTPSRTYPLVTVSLILANLLIFLYELSLPAGDLEGLIQLNGLIPERIQHITEISSTARAATARSLFASMFLHAGWLHLISNMWYLWIFGDNVEDRMGHTRFLFFYLLCGTAAGATHVAFNWGSDVPTIGASGAVAGVLGAYLVTFPFARIATIIPFFIIWPIIHLPAVVVLGSWFLVQLLSGTGGLVEAGGKEAAGVAWWAHIGGFVFGAAWIRVITGRRLRRHR